MKKYQFEKTDSTYYMNVEMVSKYIHFAKSTIYKWVEEKYIPYKKLGKRVIFIKEHIDEWVLNNGVIVEDLPDVPKYKTIVKVQPSAEYHRRPTYRPAA
jgi:excisionase family DNA binding protein